MKQAWNQERYLTIDEIIRLLQPKSPKFMLEGKQFKKTQAILSAAQCQRIISSLIQRQVASSQTAKKYSQQQDLLFCLKNIYNNQELPPSCQKYHKYNTSAFQYYQQYRHSINLIYQSMGYNKNDNFWRKLSAVTHKFIGVNDEAQKLAKIKQNLQQFLLVKKTPKKYFDLRDLTEDFQLILKNTKTTINRKAEKLYRQLGRKEQLKAIDFPTFLKTLGTHQGFILSKIKQQQLTIQNYQKRENSHAQMNYEKLLGELKQKEAIIKSLHTQYQTKEQKILNHYSYQISVLQQRAKQFETKYENKLTRMKDKVCTFLIVQKQKLKQLEGYCLGILKKSIEGLKEMDGKFTELCWMYRSFVCLNKTQRQYSTSESNEIVKFGDIYQAAIKNFMNKNSKGEDGNGTQFERQEKVGKKTIEEQGPVEAERREEMEQELAKLRKQRQILTLEVREKEGKLTSITASKNQLEKEIIEKRQVLKDIEKEIQLEKSKDQEQMKKVRELTVALQEEHSKLKENIKTGDLMRQVIEKEINIKKEEFKAHKSNEIPKSLQQNPEQFTKQLNKAQLQDNLNAIYSSYSKTTQQVNQLLLIINKIQAQLARKTQSQKDEEILRLKQLLKNENKTSNNHK